MNESNHDSKEPLPTPLAPLGIASVKIESGFWADRLRVNGSVTVPHIHDQCDQTGRFDVWDLDWSSGRRGEHPHVFWDSDVAKWLEAAAYAISTGDAPAATAAQVDRVVGRIVAAQQDDGYLNSFFTAVKPHARWSNLRDWHELYCAGHLLEAAVAVDAATGDARLLTALSSYTDLIGTVFGTGESQRRGYPGHQEIELALVRAYRYTGDSKYLQLATYFVDERGRQPHYFDVEAKLRGEDPDEYWAGTHEYTQSHVPVRQQSVPVGHAVRGMYLYCAMADLALELEDAELLSACRRIWEHTVYRRMYVTGSIGASHSNEGHTRDYDLPNASAYAETCAAIGLFLFSHRMLQIERDGRYADVMERALYNGILSGVSWLGDTFFYVNPLESAGYHHRWSWYHCVCCPPNLARLVGSLGQYCYSVAPGGFYIHQFVPGTAAAEIDGIAVKLKTKTDYPATGRINIILSAPRPVRMTLHIRKPGWCPAWRVQINGKTASGDMALHAGYLNMQREWHDGDAVAIDFDMPAHQIEARPEVRDAADMVALQRGPIIYCAEEADNGEGMRRLLLSQHAGLRVDPDGILGSGLPSLEVDAKTLAGEPWHRALYRPRLEPKAEEYVVRAVPYALWGNREPGRMRVWFRKTTDS